MQNIYLKQPYLFLLQTAINGVRSLDAGLQQVALEQSNARPSGGGQPADRVELAVDGVVYPVLGLSKSEGHVWLTVASSREWKAGEAVTCTIDEGRRRNLTRCHTLTHLLMASLRLQIPGYESCGAEILEDEATCKLWFSADRLPTDSDLAAVDIFSRSVIAQDRPVRLVSVKSQDAAREQFPYWRADSTLDLKGKIRVVEIVGLDANPCSGTHCLSTGEVGPYRIDVVRYRPDKQCFELVATRQDGWTYWYGDGALTNTFGTIEDANRHEQVPKSAPR